MAASDGLFGKTISNYFGILIFKNNQNIYLF